ncbi:phenylalanine--tRNA ligase subunit beta [bacterium]|nr:phenylalanine--tRNA ligase subunit beta [bacterium]
MLVPYSWLKEYVDLQEDVNQVAELLQQIGIPVENVERQGPDVQNVLTCKITKIEPHPDADRLRVCQVELDGGRTLQIVTAAFNARADQYTAVAVHGAVLADGTKIKKGKMRGVLSEGMFCGADSVGFDIAQVPEELREGILDLQVQLPEGSEIPLGRPITEVLPICEDVLVLESFANRPDQLSILGIARELAAKLERPLHMPETLDEGGACPVSADSVDIRDPEACPRYIARYIDDVQIAPAPSWMVRRLEAAGMRGVNNVVDITNYVMLETGQPLHAFDRDRVAQDKIIVRRTAAGEKLDTLDGEQRELPENAIVIADPEKIIGVAGVMGGLNSEITESTKRLVLESASFDCGSIRRASLRLGLRTESSKRFEKGMDIARADFGSRRAAYLLAKYAGRAVPGCVEQGCSAPEPRRVTLRPSRVAAVLGVEIPREQALHYLEALGFSCEETSQDLLTLTVPSYRQDISEEVDLIEEIARFYGYDNLPNTIPDNGHNSVADSDNIDGFMRIMAVCLGLTEVITPSLHSRELGAKYRVPEGMLTIMNPLSEEQRCLRTYLYPALGEVIVRNHNNRNDDMRIFEISRVYIPKADGTADEQRHLGIALSYAGADFFALKGITEHMAASLHQTFVYRPCCRPFLHPGRGADITLPDGTVLGWIGELHPSLLSELGLESPIIAAEFNLELMRGMDEMANFEPFSSQPAVERDLAFVVDEKLLAGDVEAVLRKSCGKLLQSVTCFDVFRSLALGAGKKSLAFRLVLQSFDATLTDAEIQKTVTRCVKAVERELNGQLRS